MGYLTFSCVACGQAACVQLPSSTGLVCVYDVNSYHHTSILLVAVYIRTPRVPICNKVQVPVNKICLTLANMFRLLFSVILLS